MARPKEILVVDPRSKVKGTYTVKRSGIIHAVVEKHMTVPWRTHTQHIDYDDGLCGNAAWFPWDNPMVVSRTYNKNGKVKDVTCKGCLRSLQGR